MDSNKADAAVKALEKAVKLEDSNAGYHLWLARALGAVAQRANVLRQPFLAKRVKAEFERTVRLDPSNLGGHEGLLQFYLQAPGVMGGSSAKARAEAEAIAKVNPMRGHFARATIANREKDAVSVEREDRAAVAGYPDSLVAVNTLANLLANTNRADEAFATMDRFLTRRPGDVNGAYALGRIAAITGKQLDRGEQALRTVLAAPGVGTDSTLPSPANAHYRLGDILRKRGERERATGEYEMALKLNPRHEAAKRALASLKER